MRKRVGQHRHRSGQGRSPLMPRFTPAEGCNSPMGMTQWLVGNSRQPPGALWQDENGGTIATNGFGDRKTYAGNFLQLRRCRRHGGASMPMML